LKEKNMFSSRDEVLVTSIDLAKGLHFTTTISRYDLSPESAGSSGQLAI
jgi:hypothetical protein